jgi:small-conductance mechanosensitive channel
MSETSEQRLLQPGDVVEMPDERDTKITALTQRAEQAERERDRLRELSQKQQGEIEDIGYMADAVERLREIANATGCDHVDDSDGRLRLVSCVEQVIWSAECKAETAEAEVKRLRDEITALKSEMTNAQLHNVYE